MRRILPFAYLLLCMGFIHSVWAVDLNANARFTIEDVKTNLLLRETGKELVFPGRYRCDSQIQETLVISFRRTETILSRAFALNNATQITLLSAIMVNSTDTVVLLQTFNVQQNGREMTIFEFVFRPTKIGERITFAFTYTISNFIHSGAPNNALTQRSSTSVNMIFWETGGMYWNANLQQSSVTIHLPWVFESLFNVQSNEIPDRMYYNVQVRMTIVEFKWRNLGSKERKAIQITFPEKVTDCGIVPWYLAMSWIMGTSLGIASSVAVCTCFTLWVFKRNAKQSKYPSPLSCTKHPYIVIQDEYGKQ